MGNYLSNECRCICHSGRFGIMGDLGCCIYHDDYECLVTCEKIKCKRCKSDYLDDKLCSASGFSLFCAAPEYYYELKSKCLHRCVDDYYDEMNYCDTCDHNKNVHISNQCLFEATPEDGFECDCKEFKHA